MFDFFRAVSRPLAGLFRSDDAAAPRGIPGGSLEGMLATAVSLGALGMAVRSRRDFISNSELIVRSHQSLEHWEAASEELRRRMDAGDTEALRLLVEDLWVSEPDHQSSILNQLAQFYDAHPEAAAGRDVFSGHLDKLLGLNREFVMNIKSLIRLSRHFPSLTGMMELPGAEGIFWPLLVWKSARTELQGYVNQGLPLAIEIDRQFRAHVNAWDLPQRFRDEGREGDSGPFFRDAIYRVQTYQRPEDIAFLRSIDLQPLRNRLSAVNLQFLMDLGNFSADAGQESLEAYCQNHFTISDRISRQELFRTNILLEWQALPREVRDAISQSATEMNLRFLGPERIPENFIVRRAERHGMEMRGLEYFEEEPTPRRDRESRRRGR